MRLAIALLTLAALVAGCGSMQGPSGTAGNLDKHYLITYEEIKASRMPGGNAYDLIAQLRPSFLRVRGPASASDLTPVQAMVYLDGVRYGKLESLKTLNIEQIREIEFINASDATTRYGTDHLGGAILIHTR